MLPQIAKRDGKYLQAYDHRIVQGLTPEPGPETAERYRLDSARPWSEFEPWMRTRMREGTNTIFVDESRRPEATGVPPGLSPVAGDRTLWTR